MATVTAFIRVSKKKIEKAHVRFRLRDGRDCQLFYKSNIKVNPTTWDPVKQEIKAKILFDTEKRAEFNRSVANMKSLIIDIYNSNRLNGIPTSEALESEVDKSLHPERYGLGPQSFFEAFHQFLADRKISDVRKRNYMVVVRALQRYELYKRATVSNSFLLTFDSFTSALLRDIERFLGDEYKLTDKYPEIYKAVPESRRPEPRGQNTINGIFTKLRTFFIWANEEGKAVANPFKNFKIEECVYGTPFYISIEERNLLYRTDLSKRPPLAVQRNIFVFQCLIGCRVGDLFKMTSSNVMNGAIEYIPRKTKDGNPITVRVPLNSIAREILNHYKDHEGPGLLPFISEQRYNDAIKDAFKLAGITRIVTIINTTTREEEKRPINEVASSHLARRCFVGNLYKQVKDPNLVGSLSGHKEGSKAFARYREIDEEMKNELVKMLE